MSDGMQLPAVSNYRRGRRREMPPVELVIAYAQECALVIDADGWHLEPPRPRGVVLDVEAELVEGGRDD